MEDEDENLPTRERFGGYHLKKTIAIKDWVWKKSSWPRHSWRKHVHEEKQVGLWDNLLLNIYYYLLNHVNYVKNVKETWNKFYATFEKHVDNKL